MCYILRLCIIFIPLTKMPIQIDLNCKYILLYGIIIFGLGYAQLAIIIAQAQYIQPLCFNALPVSLVTTIYSHSHAH
ncbi:hypothetical protein FGO68_gene16859 [Halteria grandinella]|uniref:Uncharacterized protein n=1 Tax=Halteria grandinella TaxID=5974 RepID=A0A8J8T6M0_HALGN|nr:hypothetical protein FGO68_gene16859 [Halteria grandinella]